MRYADQGTGMNEAPSPSDASIDDRLNGLEARLRALADALGAPLEKGAGEGTDATAALARVDGHLANVKRLASLVEERSGPFDSVEQTTALVMLRDLASACRDLRLVVHIAGTHLAEARDAVKRNRSDVRLLTAQMDEPFTKHKDKNDTKGTKNQKDEQHGV